MPGIQTQSRNKPSMGGLAYAYAKASGIIGKSFVGKRLRRLETVGRLSELDRMVFPDTARDLPEKKLLIDLEDRIIDRAANSIISIVKAFPSTPEFLVLLVRGYEYIDLKNAITAFLEGEKTAPAHVDIGRFQTVRFDAWPDIEAMIKGTGFNFLLKKENVLQKGRRSIDVQTALDRHYYSALWQALSCLPDKYKRVTKNMLADEISLRNSEWALRLRRYYKMNPDEVKKHLVEIPVGSDKRYLRHGSGTLAAEAVKCLEFPLDDFASWSSWRWKRFLNPDTREEHWRADPQYFQNAASKYLYHLARRYFRHNPFSLDSIFCFIKLKQFEEDILISSAEGLGMGMSSKDIVSILGVES